MENNIKQKYIRNGFLYKYRAISEKLASKTLNEFDYHFKSNDLVLKEELYYRPDMIFRSFRDIVENKNILNIVKKILGRNIVSWYSLLFYKKNKKFVSFHQDLEYWKFKNDKCLTVSLALTKSNLSNGCLHVIKGTHKKKFLHNTKFVDKNNMLASNQKVDIKNLPKPFPFILSPGEFTIHHGDTLHGSYSNNTSTPRVLFAIRYAALSNPSKIYKHGVFFQKYKNKETKNFKKLPNFRENFDAKSIFLREKLLQQTIKFQINKKIKNRLLNKLIFCFLSKNIRSVYYKLKNYL